jgi:hypothetical protein
MVAMNRSVGDGVLLSNTGAIVLWEEDIVVATRTVLLDVVVQISVTSPYTMTEESDHVCSVSLISCQHHVFGL